MRWQFSTTTSDAWRAMQEALRRARVSIYLESYIFLDDEIGREFVDILIAKAREGLDVRLVLDGLGSFWFTMQSLKRLQEAGARVLSFQSLAFSHIFKSLRRLQNRNHRKTLIIDRRIGFIGGVNVKKEYADWLDLHLEIEGEDVVDPLVHSFARTWILGGGKRRHVRDLLMHPLQHIEKKLKYIGYVFEHPIRRFKERSRVRRVYLHALKNARQQVTIATPYFIPDKKLLGAFAQTLARGVRVCIIVPLSVDTLAATYAMHAMFERMHTMGAQLFVLPTMMHGKALIVDDRWGMVGSSNIDARSFFYNHEANITFTNRAMVRDLAHILDTWRHLARPFDAIRWRRRSLFRKFFEWMMSLLAPIL